MVSHATPHKAVILARGLGSRMRRAAENVALTAEQSRTADAGVKAMISLDGRPFLDFVISALASGLAAVNLCGLILDRENIEKMFDLKKGHVVLGAAEIIALVVMFIIVASGDPQGAASIQSMLTGGFAGMFWIGLVLVGLLMPLLIGANALRASEGSQSSVALEYASECGVLVGGFMLRLLVVLAALPIVFV